MQVIKTECFCSILHDNMLLNKRKIFKNQTLLQQKRPTDIKYDFNFDFTQKVKKI